MASSELFEAVDDKLLQAGYVRTGGRSGKTRSSSKEEELHVATPNSTSAQFPERKSTKNRKGVNIEFVGFLKMRKLSNKISSLDWMPEGGT